MRTIVMLLIAALVLTPTLAHATGGSGGEYGLLGVVALPVLVILLLVSSKRNTRTGGAQRHRLRCRVCRPNRSPRPPRPRRVAVSSAPHWALRRTGQTRRLEGLRCEHLEMPWAPEQRRAG